jgi:hypothetical protein
VIRWPCRLFRKAVQQGRRERRGESYSLPYVEPLHDASTPLTDVVDSLRAGHSDGLPRREYVPVRCADSRLFSRRPHAGPRADLA